MGASLPVPGQTVYGAAKAAVERNRLYVFTGRDSRLMNLAMRIAPRLTIERLHRRRGRSLEGR